MNKALRLKDSAKDDSLADKPAANGRSRVVRKLSQRHNRFSDELARSPDHNVTQSSSKKKVINYFNELEYISKGRLASEKDAYARNKFNQLVSDSIPSDRNIPDTRHPLCKTVNYDIDSLPSTSISEFEHELSLTLKNSFTKRPSLTNSLNSNHISQRGQIDSAENDRLRVESQSGEADNGDHFGG